MPENDYEDLLSSLDLLAEDGRMLEGRAAAAIRETLSERADIWDEGEQAGAINEHEFRRERKMTNPYRDRSDT